MPTQLLIIMGFQLAGEALVSGCGLSFPGPLCGLLLLLAWLNYTGGPSAELSRAADILVDHLGLLFVPAGAVIDSRVGDRVETVNDAGSGNGDEARL